MATHPRSPLSVRVAARLTSAYQTQGPGNRLALTSSGVVAAPFFQADWPNPQRKPFAVSLRTQPDRPNRLALTGSLLGSPFNQSDWQNPRRGRAQQPDALRSIALDVAAPVAAPFFGLAMDNPVLRLWSRWQHPFQQTQLPSIFATPPVQVSTALPLRRPPAHVGFVQPTFGPLVPTGPKPFAQNQWPNPRRARQAYTGPWGLWPQVIPPAPTPDPEPEPICVHELTATPLAPLTLTATPIVPGWDDAEPWVDGSAWTDGGEGIESMTADPLTGTSLTAEPPC